MATVTIEALARSLPSYRRARPPNLGEIASRWGAGLVREPRFSRVHVARVGRMSSSRSP